MPRPRPAGRWAVGPPRRRAAVRLVAVTGLLLAAPVLHPGAALADVTVAASRAEAGARNVTITFRVTNRDPAVPTIRLQVFLPTVRPLRGVRPSAATGWTAQVDLAPPTAAAPGSPIPTEVTWDAGTVTGTHSAVFPLDVDRLPDGAGPLRFRVVQTFADGTTEEWSDLVPYGAPAPAHPALEIPYSSTPGAAEPADAAWAAGGNHQHGDEAVILPPRGATVWAFLAVAATAGTAVGTAAGALGRRQARLLAASRNEVEPPR
jgi:Domain of unkown function (DUF1775)